MGYGYSLEPTSQYNIRAMTYTVGPYNHLFWAIIDCDITDSSQMDNDYDSHLLNSDSQPGLWLIIIEGFSN